MNNFNDKKWTCRQLFRDIFKLAHLAQGSSEKSQWMLLIHFYYGGTPQDLKLWNKRFTDFPSRQSKHGQTYCLPTTRILVSGSDFFCTKSLEHIGGETGKRYRPILTKLALAFTIFAKIKTTFVTDKIFPNFVMTKLGDIWLQQKSSLFWQSLGQTI